MTHEGLEGLLHLLNHAKMSERERQRIFICTLTENVDFARVWRNEPRGNVGLEGSEPYYLVKVGEVYASIIFDMGAPDLHAFTSAAYRDRGLVTTALDQVVLPKLWQEGRKVQEVTFENLEAGARFAMKLGFRVTAPGHAEKDLSVYQAAQPILPVRRRLTRDEFLAMRTDIGRAKLYVKMVKERLELAYGDAEGLLLDELIYDELGNLADRCEDFMESKGHELGFTTDRDR